jgi:hypothetical protein
MMFTRLGYSLILMIVAAAAVAVAVVAFVAWPGGGSSGHTLDAQQVVNYSRFHVIDSIDQNGRTLTVHFNKDFDTKKAFGTGAHEFTSTLPQGEDIVAMLTAVGVPINGADGIQVTTH